MRNIIFFISLITGSISATSLDSIQKACVENKIEEACYTLAIVYSKGFGAPQDIIKAKFYYNLANKYGIYKSLEDNSTLIDLNNTINAKLPKGLK